MTFGQNPIGQDDLQAAIDGRLDPARAALVEAWLAENPEMAARVAAIRADREALRERLAAKAAEPLPARLRIAHLLGERARRRRQALRRAAMVVLWLGAGAALGWFGHGWSEAPPQQVAGAAPSLTSEALTAHRTYVVEVRHPVEVEASQQAHLVQWLSRRLGHDLKAPDLASLGWRLMGGRLLPADAGPAAQLMYENAGGKRLTVYLRADGEKRDAAFRYTENAGVGAFWWVENGFGYAVSGPADRSQLLTVAETVFRQCAQP